MHPRSRRLACRLGAAALGLGAAGAGYRFGLRPRLLYWGATDDEVHAELPGDELLPDADGVSTRAITIAAPPAAIYPWLVQMGPLPRGGAYTYDWIENLLGLDFHSTDVILDLFQDPRIGTEIDFGPRTMVIARADTDRAFVIAADDGNWVWSFTLVPDGERTRLISRNRYRFAGGAVEVAMMELMIPGSLVMERKMLRGIRRRAQQLALGD